MEKTFFDNNPVTNEQKQEVFSNQQLHYLKLIQSTNYYSGNTASKAVVLFKKISNDSNSFTVPAKERGRSTLKCRNNPLIEP